MKRVRFYKRCRSDEILDGETRHVVARLPATEGRSDLLVGFDDDLFGRVEPRLAERRHRRPWTCDRRRAYAAASRLLRGRGRGGCLAVVLDDG